MLKIANTAVIIIDMQTKLWNVMAEKEALLENAQKLVKSMQLMNVPVILTEQNPKGLGQTLPELTQLMPGVAAIPKFCFSCHENTSFEQAVRSLQRNQLVICGIEAHICVYQTALGLIDHGYEVQVVADAVSSRVVRNRDITLMRLQSEGAKLTTVEMLIYELMGTAESPYFKDLLKVIK